ncbi:MAG: lysostaphin resistance A-like protein [Hyphomicrobiaceae bacterium]
MDNAGAPGSAAIDPRHTTGLGGLFRGEPAYRPRTNWPLIPAIVATLGIVIVAMAAGLTGSLAATPADPAHRTEGVWPFVAALAASQVAAIAVTLLAARAFESRAWDVLAMGKPRQGPFVYPAAMLLMLLVFGTYSLAVWFAAPNVVVHDLEPFAALMHSDGWWIALLAISIGAPLMEEIVFRGFLLSALARSRIGFVAGSVISSAAWTGLHASYSLLGLLEVFAVGLYFSWLLWRTGSLRVPIFCHAAYNLGIALFLLVFGLPSTVAAVGG